MLKRFLFWLIDWRPAAKAALYAGFNAEDALRELKETVFSPASVSENADNWAHQSPRERWESQAGSLTSADLAVYYRQNAWLSWIFFFGCLTLFLFGYWNIIRGYRWGGATGLIYAAVLFLWFVKASWKCWIIDQRAIHPISAWVRTPIAWNPPLEIPKWLTVGLCSVFLLCIIPPAQAVFVSDIFRPPATDLSVWMLREALGPLVAEEMGGSSGNIVATDIITWMLSHIVIPLGGIILLYSSYLGLSHAGMSAELFGDKKQAYWVAARTIFAFGMVTPAPGLKGLALINLFVISWTLHGAGAASSLWVQVSKSLTSTAISGNPSQINKDLFDKMLLGEMCAATYNEYAIKQSGYSDEYLVSFKHVGQSAGAGGTDKASVWVWSQKDTFKPFCGQIIAKEEVKVDAQGVAIPSRTVQRCSRCLRCGQNRAAIGGGECDREYASDGPWYRDKHSRWRGSRPQYRLLSAGNRLAVAEPPICRVKRRSKPNQQHFRRLERCRRSGRLGAGRVLLCRVRHAAILAGSCSGSHLVGSQSFQC